MVLEIVVGESVTSFWLFGVVGFGQECQVWRNMCLMFACDFILMFACDFILFYSKARLHW